MILDVGGHLTADGSEGLTAEVRLAADRGFANILLNLVAVSNIDSVGLTQLVRARGIAQSHGGQLKLEHVGADVQTLLRLTRVDALLPVFDDEDEALAAFAAPATHAA